MTTIMDKTRAKPDHHVPILPTREEYRHGMQKLRETIDCPVLSADEQALADELRGYDWSADATDSSKTSADRDRQSVDDYLKQQYQQNMLARYPEFERRTDSDIQALKLAVDQMYVFNVIVCLALLLGATCAVFVWIV